MHNMKRALVVYEVGQQLHPALLHGRQMAKKFGLDLQLLAVVFEPAYEILTLLSNSDRDALKNNLILHTERMLADVCEGLVQEGIRCDYRVAWNRKAYKAICEEAAKDDVQLVIKGTHPHSILKQIFVTPTDWNLLRFCPAPVLLVKNKSAFERGNIVVAVDSASEDVSHQELNRNLLSHAKFIAKLTNQQIHVINVYPFPILEVPVEFSALNYEELQRQSKSLHLKQTKELLADFGIPESQQHVVAGLPEEAIAEKVVELDAHLLLMGTVGRKGLKAAVIGNTAEHTVDKVSCDVLALKPADYIDFLVNTHEQNNAKKD